MQVNDKIKYTNAYSENLFPNIRLGTIFEIKEISRGYVFAEAKGDYFTSTIVLPQKDIEKYFVKVNISNWSMWKIINPYSYIKGVTFYEHWFRDWIKERESDIKIESRNNSKKTEVRIRFNDNTTIAKGTACCNTTDKFCKTMGIHIALLRAFKNMFNYWIDNKINILTQ